MFCLGRGTSELNETSQGQQGGGERRGGGEVRPEALSPCVTLVCFLTLGLKGSCGSQISLALRACGAEFKWKRKREASAVLFYPCHH